MHGKLLLACLALSVAAAADAGERTASATGQRTSAAAPRAGGMLNGSRPSSRVEAAPFDSQVQPAAYVAQHPNPGEPLGFSESQFNPHEGPAVDPAAGGPEFEEYYEAPQPGFFSGLFSLDAPAPVASSGEWLRSGCWYTQQSVVYMSRSNNIKNELELSRDFSSSIDPVLENRLVIPLDPGFEPGYRGTIGRYLGRDARNRDHSVEFQFVGLTHWLASESMTAQIPGAIFSSIDPTLNIPVFNASNQQFYSLVSDYNSYEINYRIDRRLARDRMVYSRDGEWIRTSTPALLPSAFAGIRTVFINESLRYSANSAAGTGTYDVVTHNDLVGIQFGGDLFVERQEWRVGARVKGAPMVNWASQSSVVRIQNDNGVPLVPNRDEYVKDHALSFLGELSFIGEYRYRPNFGLRLSYDLMWVTELALAQNQVTFFPSDPAQISNSHSIFFQGVSLGIEWSR